MSEILEWMDASHIFSITPHENDSFIIREECDGFYRKMLSRDELRQLAAEIAALANQ